MTLHNHFLSMFLSTRHLCFRKLHLGNSHVIKVLLLFGFCFIYFYFSDHTLWILFKYAAQISTILQQYVIPKACPLRPHGSDLDNRPKYWKHVFGGLFVKAIWFSLWNRWFFFSLLSKRKEIETFWKIILVVYCVNFC